MNNVTPPTAELMVDTAEVSRVTGLSPWTVAHLRRKGVLPAYKFGYRRFRFLISEVVPAIQRLKTQPKEAA